MNSLNSRRLFLQRGGLAVLPFFAATSLGFADANTEFRGIVSTDEDGEALRIRDGTALVICSRQAKQMRTPTLRV